MILTHLSGLFLVFLHPIKYVAAIFVLIGLAVAVVAEPLRVMVTGNTNPVNQGPEIVYEKMVMLALEKTRVTDGDFVLLYNTHGGGIARDRAMLIAGVGIDVMWASVTREREQQMRVVPVDLLKGLNNYRVLLIHKDTQPQFSAVNSLEDLKKFTVGSGEHWTDGDIFRDNGFKVVATSNYSGLFKMLAARRFNFISRGLYEIEHDVKEYKALGLIQEATLLLKYDTPIRYCLFVNKNNAALGDRLERGLKLAQEDGSFDHLFYQYPPFRAGEYLLKNSSRRVFELKNTKID